MGYIIQMIFILLVTASPAIVIIIWFFLVKDILHLIINYKIEGNELNLYLINKNDEYRKKYDEYLKKSNDIHLNFLSDFRSRKFSNTYSIFHHHSKDNEMLTSLYNSLPKKIKISRLFLKILFIICFCSLLVLGIFILYRIFSIIGIWKILVVSVIALIILRIVFDW